ncbi:hypothetical protein K502DRAFT_326118, partial [Neoconidiobolus thromboides FSU 785]
MRFNTLILPLFFTLITAQSSNTDSSSSTQTITDSGSDLQSTDSIMDTNSSNTSLSGSPTTVTDSTDTSTFGNGIITNVTFIATPTTDDSGSPSTSASDDSSSADSDSNSTSSGSSSTGGSYTSSSTSILTKRSSDTGSTTNTIVDLNSSGVMIKSNYLVSFFTTIFVSYLV